MHDNIADPKSDQPEPSLPRLVAWLEAQVIMLGPEAKYAFFNLNGPCLYAQYGMSLWPDLDRDEAANRVVAALDNRHGEGDNGVRRDTKNSSLKSWEVAATMPFTFGAALTRAGQALAERKEAARAEADEFLRQVNDCKTVAEPQENIVLRDDVLVFLQHVRALPGRTF